MKAELVPQHQNVFPGKLDFGYFEGIWGLLLTDCAKPLDLYMSALRVLCCFINTELSSKNVSKRINEVILCVTLLF